MRRAAELVGNSFKIIFIKYRLHLLKDPKFKKVLLNQDDISLSIEKNLVKYLCASIIGQQLSVKVAALIRDRFFALLDARKNISVQILNLDIDSMRMVGLSASKVAYIKNVAIFSVEHQDKLSRLHGCTDEEIIAILTEIKGIGKWTVEMLLMFAMGREDVFPVDDLGIQEAMIKLYSIKAESKKELKIKMNKVSLKWRPYRTYACLHLWKWKDS
jgi:DNA-3-methyladenine glycosylase II